MYTFKDRYKRIMAKYYQYASKNGVTLDDGHNYVKTKYGILAMLYTKKHTMYKPLKPW